MKNVVSKLVTIFIASQMLAGTLLPSAVAFAETSSDLQTKINSDNDQIATLNQQIAEYQAQLKQAGADKKTLTSAINQIKTQQNSLKLQIKATNLKISSINAQLSKTKKDMGTTAAKQARLKAEVSMVIRLMNVRDEQVLLESLSEKGGFASVAQSIKDYSTVFNTLAALTNETVALNATLKKQKDAYQIQESDAEKLLNAKSAQEVSLSQTVKTKNQLLVETKNKESTYQKLLAEAQAELKSYSNFTENSGGALLLNNQTSCDSWGCYYNQRDSDWGGRSLNGTTYSLASDGCLVTSMAMIMTHYGYSNVTPATINSNPDNFASYYPAYLLTTITAGGVTAARVKTTIDAALGAGTPVVIGMKVKEGTHFVVLVSGSKGKYVMRDPYLAGGKDIDFSSHYRVKDIYSVAKVVINS